MAPKQHKIESTLKACNFIKCIFAEISKEISTSKIYKTDEFKNGFVAMLFGISPGKTKPKEPIPPILNYRYFIFQQVNEILSAFERVCMAEIYVARFPYSGTSITKSAHLRYVYENYLNDIYILEKRIENSIKKMCRENSRHTGNSKLSEKVSRLNKRTEKFFKKLNVARGNHVHVQFMKTTEIEKVAKLESLLSGGCCQAKSWFNYVVKCIRITTVWLKKK